MGILYDKSIKIITSILIEELAEMNVYRTVQDKSIYEADYDDLKETLALACLKRVDIGCDDAKFF
ncbi:hypothetical protein [Mesobacillus stamsii]|uniref:Uncharacterized protein n=1 Tax=Mesobacillus stamsii TaxID=225347 RepID=A0ABU0FWA6_9BACI|nr:hypothetical protein [Mesobacillus stamsii]MDQ0414215.1 hypothetical protein [Mesobacillus stamsii]